MTRYGDTGRHATKLCFRKTMLAAEVKKVIDPVSLAGRKYFDNSGLDRKYSDQNRFSKLFQTAKLKQNFRTKSSISIHILNFCKYANQKL